MSVSAQACTPPQKMQVVARKKVSDQLFSIKTKPELKSE